jgi:hypothetical protein
MISKRLIQAPPQPDDVPSRMTDVEALLSVDGGKVPQGIMAFFEEDEDPNPLRARAVLALVTLGAAAACAYGGAGRFMVALMVLAAAGLAIAAWPTLPAEGERPRIKRPVMVVTSQGIIVRDEVGLRSWQFADLTAVASQFHNQRPHLVLITQDGKRHAIDHLRFERSDRLRQVLDERLRVRRAARATGA